MSDHHYVALNNSDDEPYVKTVPTIAEPPYEPTDSPPSPTHANGHINGNGNNNMNGNGNGTALQSQPLQQQQQQPKQQFQAATPMSLPDHKRPVTYDDHVDGDGQDPVTFCFFIMQLSLFALPFVALTIGLIWHWRSWGGLKTGSFAEGAQCNEPLVLWLLLLDLCCGILAILTTISWLIRARCDGQWLKDPLCRRLNSTPNRQQHAKLKKSFAYIVIAGTITLTALGAYWYYSTAADHCTQTLLDWTSRFLHVLFTAALFIACGFVVAAMCTLACRRGEQRVREREDFGIPKPSKVDLARVMMG